MLGKPEVSESDFHIQERKENGKQAVDDISTPAPRRPPAFHLPRSKTARSRALEAQCSGIGRSRRPIRPDSIPILQGLAALPLARLTPRAKSPSAQALADPRPCSAMSLRDASADCPPRPARPGRSPRD